MSARERLLGWLDKERDRQVEFLQAFTRIDTCNPPGDTTEAADFFRRFLDAEGLSHRTEGPQGTMPNLISSFEGARPGRHLVLNGHLDVFPIGDRSVWKRDPLSGDIVDGRVYGRGTVDMKCGTTALLFVHAYLHRLKDALPGRVTLRPARLSDPLAEREPEAAALRRVAQVRLRLGLLLVRERLGVRQADPPPALLDREDEHLELHPGRKELAMIGATRGAELRVRHEPGLAGTEPHEHPELDRG